MIERMVLESLGQKSQNLGELHEDTGLEYGLLNCLLGTLLQKNLVDYNKGRYGLTAKSRRGDLTEKEGVKEEVRELFDSALKQHFSTRPCLKVKKIWMSERDQKIFQAQLINLEKFIDDLSRQPPKGGKTKEQKVFIWAVSDYGELLKENLQVA